MSIQASQIARTRCVLHVSTFETSHCPKCASRIAQRLANMSWLDMMQSYLAPVCKWMCDPSPATEQVVQVIGGIEGLLSHAQQAGERER